MSKIEIDLGKLTLGDIIDLSEAPNAVAAIPILDKIVIGGVRHRPLSDLRGILSILTVELEKLRTDIESDAESDAELAMMIQHYLDNENASQT